MGEDSNPVPAPGPLEEAGASSPPARIRVFLADDHAVVREGLALLLEESGQFEVVGQCGDGREVVALVEAVHPDVVVLDIHMPGLNGIDVCGELVRRNRRTLVLMLSVREEEPFILRALESGARGYLLKESAATEFTQALRAVAGGGTYLGPGIDPGVLTRLHRGPEDPYDRLTPREREVLALIAQGRTNPQIGEALGLSVRTVDVHRSHLMRKLNIHDLTTLVKFAWNRGIGLKA